MTAIHFTIPGEPKGKERPRSARLPGGGTRHYTPAQTVSYERFVAWLAKQAGATMIEGPVELHVRAWLTIPASVSKARRNRMIAGLEMPTKKPDFDNVQKAICDGLNGVAFRDDAQVVDSFFSKRWSVDPRVEVTVLPLAIATADEASAGIPRNKAALQRE